MKRRIFIFGVYTSSSRFRQSMGHINAYTYDLKKARKIVKANLLKFKHPKFKIEKILRYE